MTQNRLKRATQRGTLVVGEQWRSPTGGMGAPTGTVKAGTQGS